jgi:hypothetical protein
MEITASVRNLLVGDGLFEIGGIQMRDYRTLACMVVFLTLFLAAAASAQIKISQRGRTGTVVSKAPRQEPCWQEAGISKSAMEQRRQIEQNTRAEVQSVCNDSSLTPQQKREKIRQLHQQARQQNEGLITPQQQEALKACQQQRAAAHPPRNGRGEHPGGNRGPCGNGLE